MENKITALSDEELMGITGGLVQLINPTTCNMFKTKKKCYESSCQCEWDANNGKCLGGCL